MSTPESKGASPGPWKWDWHYPGSATALMDASGRAVITAEDDEGQDGGMYPTGDLAVREADATLIASAPEMAAMLRELEWGRGESRETDHSFCPWCANTGREGHESDCPLDALLTKVGR